MGGTSFVGAFYIFGKIIAYRVFVFFPLCGSTIQDGDIVMAKIFKNPVERRVA